MCHKICIEQLSSGGQGAQMSREVPMATRERDLESGEAEARPLLLSPTPDSASTSAPAAAPGVDAAPRSLAAFFFPGMLPTAAGPAPHATTTRQEEVTPLLSLPSLTLPPAAACSSEACSSSHGDADAQKPLGHALPSPLLPPAASPSNVAAVRCCRFCLGEEGEDPELGQLFTPCLCRDTVHHVCLRRWRATNATAFYTCNVCKWEYKFNRLSAWRDFGIRFLVVLCPIFSLLALCMLLGFIPLFAASEGSDIVLHLQNGAAAVGLLYLLIIVTAFNMQYCRMTVIAARSAAATLGMAVLPVQFQVQLVGYVLARCILVGMFFGFCMVYFFPYSGFMGFIALLLTSPAGVKALGDRLIRRAEFDQPVMEVTSAMAAQAAADQAAKAAEMAEAARQQQDDVSVMEEEAGDGTRIQQQQQQQQQAGLSNSHQAVAGPSAVADGQAHMQAASGLPAQQQQHAQPAAGPVVVVCRT